MIKLAYFQKGGWYSVMFFLWEWYLLFVAKFWLNCFCFLENILYNSFPYTFLSNLKEYFYNLWINGVNFALQNLLYHEFHMWLTDISRRKSALSPHFEDKRISSCPMVKLREAMLQNIFVVLVQTNLGG